MMPPAKYRRKILILSGSLAFRNPDREIRKTHAYYIAAYIDAGEYIGYGIQAVQLLTLLQLTCLSFHLIDFAC